MMNDEKDVVVILSGGLDSTTVLYKLLDEGKNPIALTFNYGQKATKEINCAKEICEEKGVEHHVFDISFHTQIPMDCFHSYHRKIMMLQ